MVVEGKVTTESGPQTVRITQSGKYGSVFEGTIEPVNDATVYVRDSKGNAFIFNNTGAGLYTSESTFKGEVGLGYILTIERDGIVYNSTQEFIEPINQLDSLYFLFGRYPYLNVNGDLSYSTGVDIYASYTKNEASSNYFYWDYDGTFFIRTYPELHQTSTRGGLISTPKDCCAECYRSELNQNIVISTFLPGIESTTSKLLFLRDDGFRFYSKYIMQLKRYSISREAYQFYDLLKQQLEIDGDVFDPPPVTIRGNILNTQDAEDLVVGYFSVSDYAIDTLVIERNDLETVVGLPVFRDDCRVLSNSTILIPEIWQ